MIFQANKRASSTDFFAAGAILAAAPALFVPLLPLGWADSLPPDSGSFLGACDVDADEVVSAHSLLHPLPRSVGILSADGSVSHLLGPGAGGVWLFGVEGFYCFTVLLLTVNCLSDCFTVCFF